MQSPWIYELYNQYLDYKTDGFVVEIGVGHTLREVQQFMGIPKELSEITSLDLCSSNSAGLLNIGWSGIYIETIKEYCDEAELAHKSNLDRLTIVNAAASDEESIQFLRLGDSFVVGQTYADIYPWVGRQIKTRITSDILDENNCPQDIDVMSIDVEGFEIKVLAGLDLDKYRPKILIIEIDHVGLAEVDNFIKNRYELIQSDHINGFWVRKNG
jgi:hypothetical protein